MSILIRSVSNLHKVVLMQFWISHHNWEYWNQGMSAILNWIWI